MPILLLVIIKRWFCMKRFFLFIIISMLFGSYIFAASIDSRVSQSSDDAEQRANDSMYLDSSDLEIVKDGSNQIIGMRFQGLNIPKDANITNAYIQFEVDETSSRTTNLSIFGQNSDDTQTFSSSDFDISNRPKTSNSISWSPSSWDNKNDAGLDQRTPDLKDIIQEVVNRGGWVSGNSMVFIVNGSGKRVAESYDGESSAAPHLHVEYKSDEDNNTVVELPTCYMMTDNRNAIYTVSPNLNSPFFLPGTTEQEITHSFESEGNAYRAKDGLVYAFDSQDSSDTNVSIYSIDSTNADVNLVKEGLFYGTVEAAEFYIDPSTGQEILYLLSHEYNTQLFAFEPQNSWKVVDGYPKSVSGDTNKLSSLAVDPRTGNAYAAVDYQYDNKAPKLYSINLLTGTTNFLTNLSKKLDAEGLAFGSDNRIYVEDERDGRKLYAVDPVTGVVTPAAVLGGSGDFEAISCDGGREYDFLSISDAEAVVEGDTGQKEMKFVVSLNNVATEDVSFKYTIYDMNSNSSNDYVQHDDNITITIPTGQSSAEIVVLINGDTLVEEDENFIIHLSSVTGAVLVDDSAIGSIINDDILPTVSIADKICQESGNCEFTVSLSSPYVEDIYVDYTTEDDSAVDSSDYDFKQGTLKIDAGDINGTISIAIIDDETPEYDEKFNVILNHARVGTGTYSETMYEDGKNGFDKWSSYVGNGNIENTNETIKIANSGCSNACPNVGSSCTHGYILKDTNGNEWANSSQFFASWDMRADDYSEIFFELQTRDNGVVYMTYTKELIIDKEDDGTAHDCSNDTLYTLKQNDGTWWEQPSDTQTDWGNYKYFEMGESFEDNEWHHYSRDLSDDLKTLFPNDIILNVKKLYARVYNNGTLYIDNVKLSSNREVSITDNSAVGTIINDDFQEPFSCTDATLYLSNKYLLGSDDNSGSENNSMYLHWVDRVNSPFSFPEIGDEYQKQYNALGYNVEDDYLYALYGRSLFRIGDQGKIFDLGSIDGLPFGMQQYAGTFDQDGNYFVSDWNDNSIIYKIDVGDLKVIETFNMNVSINAYDDMVFVGDKLYGAAYPSSNDRYTLYHIDLDNETYQSVGAQQLAGDKIEILYSDANKLYGVFRNGGFYEIDTDSGMRNYVSSSPELANLNDGANCQNAEIKFTDFGDAPIYYGEAGHQITNKLKLGTLVDHESGSQPNINADGDGIDEDSVDVTKLPVLTDMSRTFTIIDIPVVNNTGLPAVLSAWIDFDRNGVFDGDEKAYKSVANSSGTVTLKWNNIPNDTQAGDTYLRIRLSTSAINHEDSSSDIIAINFQDGEVEDYKIVIQESTILNAWDSDADVNNRVIKTKKVNEDIILKVASLKKDGDTFVQSVLNDIKVYLMSEAIELTTPKDINFSLGNPYDINFGKVGLAYKNAYVKFVYKDENNETMELNATDQFAIRPDRYSIETPDNLVAGKTFDITIKALNVDGDVVSNYEEEKIVYKLSHLEVHSDDSNCLAGNLDVNKVNFINGEAIIRTTYDEVGKLKFTVSEYDANGTEFAYVDYVDSGDDRFVSEGSTTSEEFAIGNIILESSFASDGGSNYTYYANKLDDMSAKLFMKITALNWKNEKAERFTDQCYAKNVNIVTNFDTTDVNTSLVSKTKYKKGVLHPILDISGDEFNSTISRELFKNGEGNQTQLVNFARTPTVALKPMKMTITDINASIPGVIPAIDTADKEVVFIYAKAHAPDQSRVGKELNALVQYEAYIPSGLNKSIYGLDNLPESHDHVNWYILPNDIRFGFLAESLRYSGNAEIQNYLVSQYSIPIIATKTPHKNRVTYKPKAYLTYSRFGSSETTHSFLITMMSDKNVWLGKGKTGKTVADNISKRGLQKMDW